MNPRQLLLSIALFGSGSAEPADFPKMPFVPPQTAEETLKDFQLPEGYRLEPVLTEPIIKEPVVTVFDGNGRMFVAEMRTYMQNIDGSGEREKTSRISMHEDTNGDGSFDRHTVFADGLKLPRMILPLDKGRIVINETDSLDLYLLTDADNDGVADRRELWWQGGPRGGNLEHQPSGLVWALDNAIYTTYNTYRLRWTPAGVKKEETASNGGQWGLGQDDYGNVYYVNAGGEAGPVSFQASVVYGTFNPGEQLAPGFKEVFPLAGVRDFQGGLGRVREPEGTLKSITSSAGIDVYRGDQLPADLRGDVLFGEPVGRLVRRAKVNDDQGMKILSNPYAAEKSEFIRSKDLYFKPVNIANAPDGTLYITDMYRGIIQEGAWVNRGSYLRKVVQQYDFDKVTGFGRIWRLAHTSTKPVKAPRMFEETAAELAGHLEHPNGWWRDTAQRLLILRQDRSVVPLLETMAADNPNALARLHALWTLQGLDALTPALVRAKMKDPAPEIRIAAIRVSESLYRAGDASLGSDIERLGADPDPRVVLQSCLTAKYLAWPGAMEFVARTLRDSTATGVRKIGSLLTRQAAGKPQEFSANDLRVLKKGGEIYASLCAACHGPNGRGVAIEGLKGAMIAPPLTGAKSIVSHPDGGIFVLLKGLQGEIDGKKYEGLMVPMDSNDDEWIASVVSYVRNNFGNHGTFATSADVARARRQTAGRKTPWTYGELMNRLPRAIPARSMKLTASENPGDVAKAIDGNPATRYSTNKPMVPGMWFQIGLEKETTISSIELDCTASAGDYPRGYEVSVSNNGKDWGKPVAKGSGKGAVTDIAFPPAKAKFIRIVQTGNQPGLYWSIHELNVFEAPNQ